MSATAEILTKLLADNSQLVEKINESKKKAEGMGAKFKELGKAIAGAFAVGQIKGFIESLFDVADVADNAAKRLGLTAESVQTLGVIAQESGLGVDGFEQAILKMNRTSAEAVAGNKNATKAFADMGIAIEEVKSLAPEQLFERVTRAMAQNKGDAETLAASYDIFGRGAGQLTNQLIAVGEKGLSVLNEQMKAHGQILSNEVITKLDDAGDAYERAMRGAKNFGASLVASVAKFGEKMADIVTSEERSVKYYQDRLQNAIYMEKRKQEEAAKAAEIAASEQKAREDAEARIAAEKAVADQLDAQAAALAEQNAVAAQLEKNQAEIADIIEQRNFDESDAQGKLELTQSRINALRLEAERLSGTDLENAKRRGEIEKEMVRLGFQRDDLLKEMEKGSLEVADNTADAQDATKGVVDQAVAARSEFGKLTKEELAQLEANLIALQAIVQNLAGAGGFPALVLPDFSQLNNIPEWVRNQRSSDAVRNFGEALRAMVSALQTVQQMGGIPDLSINLPDTSKTDLPGLVEVLKATKGARFGALDIKLQYPSTGIPLDTSGITWGTDLTSISESLKTIAALKGVVFA